MSFISCARRIFSTRSSSEMRSYFFIVFTFLIMKSLQWLHFYLQLYEKLYPNLLVAAMSLGTLKFSSAWYCPKISWLRTMRTNFYSTEPLKLLESEERIELPFAGLQPAAKTTIDNSPIKNFGSQVWLPGTHNWTVLFLLYLRLLPQNGRSIPSWTGFLGFGVPGTTTYTMLLFEIGWA